MNSVKGKGRLTSLFMVLVMLFGLMACIPKTVEAAETWDQYLAKKWADCVTKVTRTDTSEMKTKEMGAEAEKPIPVWGEGEEVKTMTAVTKEINGVSTAVFEIRTPEELSWAISQANGGLTNGKTLEILNDLDMNGEIKQENKGDVVNVTSTYKLWPSPTVKNLTILGNDYTVYNLSVSGGNNIGFIGTVSGTVTMNDLHFRSAKIYGTGSSGHAGIVANSRAGVTNMDNCSLENALVYAATSSAGGLLGASCDTSTSTVIRSRINNSHTKNVYVGGGACGGNLSGPPSGTFENCYAIEGVVVSMGTGDSGGFISCAGAMDVRNCFTNVSVYGKEETGGFCGAARYDNAGIKPYFENCYSSGIVEGTKNIGGFVGQTGHSSVKGTIAFKNCYSTAMVGMQNGGINLGGFTGTINSSTSVKAATFENCYAAGEVGALDTEPGKTATTGGFSGGSATTKTTITNCFYDKQTTAMKDAAVNKVAHPNVAGKRTKELTGHTAEGDPTGTVIVDGFDTSDAGAWTTEKGMYPQLKAFTDPVASGFDPKDAAVARAYSVASASTVFLRDDADAEHPDNYDTVRSILDLFSFTSKAKNDHYGFKWEVDPAHYDAGKNDIYNAVIKDKDGEFLPVLSFSKPLMGKDDRVVDMAPGIGWAKVTSAYKDNYEGSPTKGQTINGNRALRIVPTTTLSLGTADPNMGIGSDVRLYPEIEGEKKVYDHREGVSFIRTTSKDLLEKKEPQSGKFTSTEYKDVPVMIKYPSETTETQKGVVNIVIEWYGLDGVLLSEDILAEKADATDEEKAQIERYRTQFISAGDDIFAKIPFTKEDYGTYVINYAWNDGEAIQKNSKKLYVLPAIKVNYKWNVPETAIDGEQYNGTDLITGADKSIVDIYGNEVGETKLRIDDTLAKRTVDMPENPVRSGYQFIGWSIKPETTEEEYKQTGEGAVAFTDETPLKEEILKERENLTVYAVWKVRHYDLQFMDADYFKAENPGMVTGLTYGSSIESDGKTLPAYYPVGTVNTEKNTIFLGWSTMNKDNLPNGEGNKKLTQIVNFDEKNIISTKGLAYAEHYGYFKDEDKKEDQNKNTVIALYPVYKTYQSDVSFYKNDGSDENGGKGALVGAVQSLKYNDPIAAPANPSRGGYTFKGFSLTPEKDFEPGGGSAYVPDYTSGMNFTGDTDPLDYYAVWEKNCSIVLKKNYNSQDDSIYGTLSTEYNKALGDKLPDVGTVNAPKREGYTFAGWSTAGREATTANIDGTTVFTASETTAYAIWVRIPYTATLYQNESPEDTKVIGTIADLTWGDHLTKDQMITPERSGGYTFVGWNTAADGKGEDFVPEKSAVKGNTNLYAQWTKKPYVLNVYETPVIGEKPDNTIGPFAYGQSIKDAFPKAAAFWTNEKGVKRAFTGWVDHRGTTVTADTVYQIGDVPGDVGTLMAKYDAMAYDVTGTKIGHGSIKGQGTYAFGANPVVSWTPDKGYKVSQINVDGRIRDDLLNGGAAGSVGFMTIDKNHTVQVTFVKNNGSGDPEDPGIDDPDKAYYTVTTTKIGGDAANTLTTLTPTSTVTAGKDFDVSWKSEKGYHVSKISVDGADYPVSDNGKVTFDKIGQDHSVVVTFESDIPDFDQGTTPGFWTITTRQVGGDPKNQETSLTPTTVVRKNSAHSVSWSANKEKGYTIKSIIIDKGTKDERELTPTEMDKKVYDFVDITKDHTVDVLFHNEEDGQPGVPEEQYLKVETKIVGGPGEITGSAAVKAGESYTVSWKLPESITDPASDTYNHYLIDQIFVNGELKDKALHETELSEITNNQKVTVVLKPNLKKIETEKEGQGNIAASKTLFYGQQYPVSITPSEGYYLSSLEVNGELTTYEKPATEMSLKAVRASEPAPEGTIVLLDGDKIVTDYHIKAIFARQDSGVEPASKRITTSIVGGTGTITPGSTVAENGDAQITWTVDPDFVVDRVTVKINGIEQADYPVDAASGSLVLTDIVDDYEIIVTLKPGDGKETPEETQRHSVTTSISGGAGATITPSMLNLRPGSSQTVTWSYPDVYIIDKIIIDGSEMNEASIGLSYTFDNIDKDHRVDVLLKLKEEPEKPLDPPPINPEEKTHVVYTSISNASGGQIDRTSTVIEHTDHTVSWTVQENYKVSAVIVDGIVRDDLREAGQVVFKDIMADHSVTIILELKDSTPPDIKPESYIVATSREGRGSVTPTTGVKAGADHRVTFTPDKGYKTARVEIDGVSQPDFMDKGQIIFEKMSGNHRVNIIFEKEQQPEPPQGKIFMVNVILEDGIGTVSESVTLNEGDNHTVKWKAAVGYHVASVSVNGTNRADLLNANSYTIKNITSHQEIRIVFAKDTNGGQDNNGENGENSGENGNNGDVFEKQFDGSYITMTGVSPLTGIRDRAEMAASKGENRLSNQVTISPLLARLMGESGNSSHVATQMSLADLLATAAAMALAGIAFLFKRKEKGMILIIATVLVVLFLLTQPLVLTFRIFDIWSGLFLLMLLISGCTCFLPKEKEKECKEDV